MFFRALQILTALVATFIGLSLFMTIAFRFVPVPVTWTMALDENGYSKDWRSLDDIDRNMVRAVIAAEDQNFCEHNGFDYAAMQAAMENNLKGKKLPRSASRPPRTCSCGRAAASFAKGWRRGSPC